MSSDLLRRLSAALANAPADISRHVEHARSILARHGVQGDWCGTCDKHVTWDEELGDLFIAWGVNDCAASGRVVPIGGNASAHVTCEREQGHAGPHRAVQSEARYEWR